METKEQLRKRYIIRLDSIYWSYRIIDIINNKVFYIKCFRFEKIKFIYTYLLFSLMRDTEEYKASSLQEVIEKLYNYDYTLLKQNIIDKGNKFNIFRTSLKLMKCFKLGNIEEINRFLQGLELLHNTKGNIDENIVLLLRLFGIGRESMLHYVSVFRTKMLEDSINILYSKTILNEFDMPSIFFANRYDLQGGITR